MSQQSGQAGHALSSRVWSDPAKGCLRCRIRSRLVFHQHVPTMTTTMAAETVFLLRDEYIDRQNRHDKHLNEEFRSIRDSINQFESEFKELKNDVNHRFNDMNHRFNELKDEVKESKAEFMRHTSYMRNNSLRNPKYPIRPLSAIHGRDIRNPDPSLFPRHAEEFYALRDPSTDHQRRMLAYLVSFYDIPHAPHSTSSDSDDDDSSIIIQDPEDAVDLLEHVLGLHEDKFKDFGQRAQEFANRPRPPPIKRSQLQPPEEVQHTHRPKLDSEANLRHHGSERVRTGAAPSGSDSVDNARLEWGTRSTPSSRRPTLNQLRQKSRDLANNVRERSDAGSTTNPNTSVREDSDN